MGLQYKNFMNSPEKYYITMDFVRDERGHWIQRRLITSEVVDVINLDDRLAIQTKNSIYLFEKAELPTVVYLDEANLIELYLSQEEEYMFAKGIYYDCNKNPHELSQLVHSGMFQDSVLLELPEKSPVKGYACRYFPLWHEISFYNVMKYKGQYVPMFIHNEGKNELVYSKHQKEKIVIPSGESVWIDAKQEGAI